MTVTTVTSLTTSYSPLLDNISQNMKFLQHGPISIEFFETLWNRASYRTWLYILQNKVYFPSELLLREEFLIEKVALFDSEDTGTVARDFITALMDNPFTPKLIAQKYINEWYISLLTEINATPVALEVFMETFYNEPLYKFMVFHKNMPVPTTAHFMLNSMNVDDISNYKFKINLFEIKCNEYLMSLGWDKETLDSLPLQMKLEVVYA